MLEPCQLAAPATAGFTVNACCTDASSIGSENVTRSGSVGATSPSGWPALHWTDGPPAAVGLGTGVALVAVLAARLLATVVANDWLLVAGDDAADAAAWGLLVAVAARCGPIAQLLSSVRTIRSEQA